jgi:hypothetical protein
MSTGLKSPRWSDKHADAERRRTTRTPHVAEAWVCSPTATSPDERTEVQSLNLSRHGVGFELPTPLPEGTFYTIELGVGEQRLRSEVRIISCRRNDAGGYDVGAEFC